MKVAERVSFDDNEEQMVIKTTWDFLPALRVARMARDAGASAPFSDSKHIASFPANLGYEWAAEAGVAFDDSNAMQEVIARNLADPKYAHFRVWQGTF